MSSIKTAARSWPVPAAASRRRARATRPSSRVHRSVHPWLQRRRADALAGADADRGIRGHSVDWIIVQMHQDALSSSKYGNGSDKGIREAWLPLFDRYGVDLVLCGHDHDYERSWPVRGCNHDVRPRRGHGRRGRHLQPQPVITAQCRPGPGSIPAWAPFISSWAAAARVRPLDAYGVNPQSGVPQAKVITKPNRPMPGASRPAPSPSPEPMPWRMRSGPRAATPRPATASRCSTWIRHTGRQDLDHRVVLPRRGGGLACLRRLRAVRNAGAAND
jgi:hypothetical protein